MSSAAGDPKVLFLQAREAVERDEPEAARAIAERLASAVGSDDARLVHLEGMLAWVEGDIEVASSKLLAAADAGPEDPQIFIDCAEFNLATGLDIDAGEACLRALLGRESLNEDTADEARITLAQCRLEHPDPDPEEALEILEGLSDGGASTPLARSTRAAALLDMGRSDDAIALLEAAEVDDPLARADLRYQLGVCYAMAGRNDEAVAAMIAVRDLDDQIADYEAMDDDEVAGLRSIVDELLEDLPEPLLKRVATVPVKVERRASDAHIASGVDPRAFVGFAGDAGAEKLEAIVIMRDALLDGVDDESELAEALVEAMIDEFRRFFGLEDLAAATN